MKDFSYTNIRKAYIDFMVSKGHKEIMNASLVPENDPSILFTSAGMSPIIPYLVGEKHPSGKKLTNVQRCIRTVDIDNIGDEWHCTAFEMLGNWSLNDYFKKEAINLIVEFFTKTLGLDINNIYASVFEGDNQAPRDDESIKTWTEIFKESGIDAKCGKGERIQPFGKKENWWELSGGGPCGPDAEIFYDTGKEPCGKDCNISCGCEKYVEIGNNVFMEYLKEGDTYKDLGLHNVDFGGGLVRIAGMLQNVDSYYEVDIFKPILEKVNELSKDPNIKSKRIIIDHINSATWIIMDGVVPGRNEREYVLRKLIRRAIRHGKLIGITKEFTREVAEVCIDQFKNLYPLLSQKKDEILNILKDEEKNFNQTIEQGKKQLNRGFSEIGLYIEGKEKERDQPTGPVGPIETSKVINLEGFGATGPTGADAFDLYETYGYPVEMTIGATKEMGLPIDKDFMKDFNKAKEDHKKKSQSASVGFFKGGLSDTSGMSTKYHTTTHLLLAALRKVLGDHVVQKGSNITPERMRFDFPIDQKLTPEQVKEVEDIVNEQIEKKQPVIFKEMNKEEAMALVPGAVFAEKYGNTVKVYFVGSEDDPYSIEICDGPHVENTSELGKFKIVKQENVGAGVKRIKAILE